MDAKKLLAGGALFGAALGPVGWFGTDHLEQRNDFCNACHLTEDVPLHIDVRRDFDAPVAESLGGLHGLARVGDGGEERAFRCIDCHGGVGFVGRARVKALAAKDTLVWLSGHFEEPDGMHWPLRDADCAQCHASFDTSDPGWETPRFHQLPVHNVRLGVDCVECHEVHQSGGTGPDFFLRTEHVRVQCGRCHAEFQELAQG